MPGYWSEQREGSASPAQRRDDVVDLGGCFARVVGDVRRGAAGEQLCEDGALDDPAHEAGQAEPRNFALPSGEIAHVLQAGHVNASAEPCQAPTFSLI